MARGQAPFLSAGVLQTWIKVPFLHNSSPAPLSDRGNSSTVHDMSDLRRRAKIEEKLEGKPSDAPGAQSPIHTPGRGGRVLTVLIFVSLVGVTWILSRSGSVSSQESYALCSRDGAKIYTVDEHDYKVQCIVVHGHLIVDRGTLCEFMGRLPCYPA